MKTFLLTLQFAALTFIILPAQTIYVDVKNNEGTEDGSQVYPFNTIREGIAAAMPGNTVLIREGIYLPDEIWNGNHDCVLLKAGIRLLGEGPDKTVINGRIIDIELSTLSISLEKIGFTGFVFARGSLAGSFTEPNSIRECKMSAVRIEHGAGISAEGSDPGPIYGFIIENNDLGADGIIEFNQGPGAAEDRVLSNICGTITVASGSGYTYLIDNNHVQYGISDKSGICTTTISNNRISDGPIIDKSGGNDSGTEDEIIQNNMITCSDISPMLADETYKAGIIARSKSVTIRNNTVNCSGHVSGIIASTGTPFNLNGNVITIDDVYETPPDVDDATWGVLNNSGAGLVTGNSIRGGYIGYYSHAGTTGFTANEIRKSFIGFESNGMEAVSQNTIEDCRSHGMVLSGLKGPIDHNIIRNNAGSGIRIVNADIDLGGGEDGSAGQNILQGNEDFDLYIETGAATATTVFARFNEWDHTDPEEVLHYDMYDARNPGGRPNVDFLPLGGLGTGAVELCTDVTVYPNPAVGSDVEVHSETGLTSVLLTGSNGIILKSCRLNGAAHCRLDLAGLASGVYFVTVQDAKGRPGHYRIVHFN